MTENQLELLRAIANGVDSFRPRGATPEAYEEFQRTVTDLLRLEAAGYVRKCYQTHETETGMNYVCEVWCKNGLRPLGRKALGL